MNDKKGIMVKQEPAFDQPIHVGRPNVARRDVFLELVEGALDRLWLSNDGPLVREFEARVADYLGVAHCIAINNGTIALDILIAATGLSGEVIVPSWTFVATAHALQWKGITPVFADVDPETHCLDPESVRSRITENTTGILAVHLWGLPAPVDELQAIADEHGLTLLYDAAHAFGASSGGRMIGGFGNAEVLSFHATKFFNAIEGGAIVTDDDGIAERARLMRNFGFAGEDHVISEGTNGKMTEISAAMGLANFDGIDDLLGVNRRNYDAYVRGLDGIPGVRILPIASSEQRNHQYVVLLVDAGATISRDDLLAALRRNNVLARRYFWPAVHRMEPYRTLQPEAGQSLPVTERLAEEVIVLPTGTAVGEAEIRVITDLIAEAVRERS
jgi:dTDP-4-amino-4,6-dideoxygalactose transaminase